MRRWLSYLLLFFLSFQQIWAVADIYCRHEGAAQARHFGHHDSPHTRNSGQHPVRPASGAAFGENAFCISPDAFAGDSSSLAASLADAGATTAGDAQQNSPAGGECHDCHLGSTAALSSLPMGLPIFTCHIVETRKTPAIPMPPPTLPERPDWARLA